MRTILFSLSVIWVTCWQVMGLEADPNQKDPYLTGKVSEQPERRRAYEPFKELEKKRAEEEARLKWKFSEDHVVIRLASKEQLETRIANGAKANEPLEDVAGIKGVTPLFPEKAIPSMAAWRAEHPVLDRWMLAEVEKGTDIKALVATLNENTLVDVAEPDYLFQLADGGPSETADPEEPQGESGLSALPESGDANPEIDKQWHLERSKIKEAWQYLEDQGLPPGGSSGVVVAVIDSGVDYTHPDLAPNMWVNAAEIPDNGIDDDGNGIVDDIHGADFLSNSGNHNGNPTDHNGHGTHCAGIIAAVADNDLGGVGVAYNSRIMAIKAAQYNGSLTSSDIAESIYYAVENGADVINMSFGGSAPSSLTRDALEVAFGQAVLVAAAGNDRHRTEISTNIAYKPFYPAAWPFVIGVMAENTAPNSNGGNLARFSNQDSFPRSRIEYEMMAPGVQIYSTLPEGKYTAWNGTSMAAPVAAGVAALVRTKYSDKNSYSSRFVMGQLIGTGVPKAYPSLDGEAALKNTPKPDLSVIDYQIFDDPSFSEVNDGDGIVDSGETIELAVTIKNRWGKADPVTVTLSAQAAGAVGPDPFVTWDIDTVDYGAVGNFGEDDNGVIRDPEGLITGVENPFRFTVSKDAFNNHIIPIKVMISAGNGFDEEDPNAPYSFSGSFDLVVQRGRVLPSVIEEDLVMTKDDYWIVDKAVLVPEGVTLTVSEGTQVQFWGGDITAQGILAVAGKLTVIGTLDQPVEFFSSPILAVGDVNIYPVGESDDGPGNDSASISMEYFKVMDPRCRGIDSAKNVQITLNYIEGILLPGNSTWQSPFFNGNLKKVNYRVGGIGVSRNIVDTCQFDVVSFSANESLSMVNSVILTKGNQRSGAFTNINEANLLFKNNAILNHYLGVKPVGPRFVANYNIDPSVPEVDYSIDGNYWGTDSIDLIQDLIIDVNHHWKYLDIIIEPILEEAPESCWPFVVDCVLSTELENDVSEVGAEEVTYTVTFNRDMDTSIQPRVYFGPDDPVTDFTVLGDWQDTRTWVGSFEINSITGDGYQQIRIQDAVAADDAWLVTGRDIGRFRFEIVTSGTEALTLQASGGEGFVDLSWGQDDFELLAGYNLYRGDQRINSSIVPAGTTSYRDTNVEPGQNYDYYFKVVLTDMSESESSNTATGTPLDTIPAVISHSAINSAQPNLARTIAADITDNVSVVGATLFYRLAGSDAEYTSREMVNATGDRFTVTLESPLLQPPGIEYYLSATDGVSTTYSGRGETPYLIVVDDKPVVTALTPNRGPASGGTVVQVTGTNFKEGSTVTFGSTLATVVTFVSSTQLEVTTPEHIPKALTVTVTNPGDRVGRLLNGYTFIDDFANIYLSDVAAESGEFVTVPLGVANVSGLASLGVTINYDPTELRFSALTKGEFLQDWVLVSNSTVDGEVRLAAASNGVALSGSGALATIEFQVLGQPGASASLSLSNTSLNGGAIIPSQTIGSVKVEEFVSIAGEVYFHGDSSKPMEGVSLNLEGAGTRSATTDESSQFLIKRLPFSDYKLSYTKADEVNGVSALDAALVLRHSVGLENLTGYGLAAADVNRDGQVLPIDAYGILRHAADIEDISVDAGGSAWGFDPAERTYTNLTENITGQNTNAYLLGDVSGNWSRSTQQNGKPVKMGVYSLSDPQNNKTLSRVLLQTGEELLNGAELILNYDPALTVTSIKCPESAYVLNTETPGELKIALASASGISGNQVLIELEFNEVVEGPAVSVSQVLLQEGGLIVSDTHEVAAFDRDGDGLLDRDEQNYFKTNPDEADSDGDGWNDGDEVTLNYKPTGADSVPVFETTLSTTYNLDGSFASYQVSFATRSGRTYHIEESSDLLTWTSREGEIVGSGTVETHQLSDLNEKVFIRVREEAP